MIKSILPSLQKPLIRLGNLLLDQALPAHCLLCGSLHSPAALCPGCAEGLPRLPPEHCPRCAHPTPLGAVCGHCLKTPPAFDCTVAPYRYDFPVDQLIQAYKYQAQLALGAWLARQLLPLVVPLAVDRLIPLPLHPTRLRDRGFNQAGEMAKILGRELGIPVDRQGCQRTKATAPQASLAHDQRARNIRHAFDCTRDYTGQHLLLVDDVMTTGATLNECARVLKLHGAARVSTAVVARAVHH